MRAVLLATNRGKCTESEKGAAAGYGLNALQQRLPDFFVHLCDQKGYSMLAR